MNGAEGMYEPNQEARGAVAGRAEVKNRSLSSRADQANADPSQCGPGPIEEGTEGEAVRATQECFLGEVTVRLGPE
jgi:hypothetical protein